MKLGFVSKMKLGFISFARQQLAKLFTGEGHPLRGILSLRSKPKQLPQPVIEEEPPPLPCNYYSEF